MEVVKTESGKQAIVIFEEDETYLLLHLSACVQVDLSCGHKDEVKKLLSGLRNKVAALG